MKNSFVVAALASATSALPAITIRQTSIWQPSQGLSWDYHLLNPASITPTAQVMAIDLFDNDAKTISALKATGTKVICYFSAGSYENWRTDWTKPAAGDVGDDVDGWEGEKWANIRSTTVRSVMAKRIALAQSKGCDAVDPDNIDGYNNDNGLGLTSKDSVDFVRFLAKEAHARKLAVGLKNSLEIVDTLANDVDFAVNEQCHQWNECDVYEDFAGNGKVVFHVEYPKGEKVNDNKPADAKKKKAICDDPASQSFSTVLKNIKLDGWLEYCGA